jgi:Cys-rich protein (TIGR04453 family)
MCSVVSVASVRPRSARRPSARHVAVVLACAALATAAVGCKERTSCEKACARVAECTRAAADGDKMLGERKSPVDQACLTKCETQPEVFEKCEGTKRSCEELRDCRGSFR